MKPTVKGRGAGAGAGHCGSRSHRSAAEAHKGPLEDSNPQRAPRRVPGLRRRWLRDLSPPERGRCGGSGRLGGGGGAARAVAPRSPRGRGRSGVAPADGGGADGLGSDGRRRLVPPLSPLGFGVCAPLWGWGPHGPGCSADVAAVPRLNPRALDRAERTCFRGCGFSGRLLLALGVRDGGPRPSGVGPPYSPQ